MLAKGSQALHDHVAASTQRTLGNPLPRIEVTFENLSLSADIVVKDATQLETELPTISNVVKSALLRATAKKHVVKKPILRNVTGTFKPGTMTLVLGQPGSGKSALMKVLSGRFPITSNITVDGNVTYSGKEQHELRKKLPEFVSYVGQHDVHYPTLTVKETLEFAHACSGGVLSKFDEEQSVHGSSEENQTALDAVRALNEHHSDIVIHQLGLENCQNTVLGDEMLRGVSGGERKRVTTGEMAFGNKLVLMMDEISTGLDSATTFDIISTQRSLAKSFGKTVVISLLQPPPEVFALFDDVMLLNDGYVMHHGPRSAVLGYFEALGFNCPPQRDVADFLVDLGTSKQHQYEVKVAPRTADEFAKAFENSEIHGWMLTGIHDALSASREVHTSERIEAMPEFNQSFWSSAGTLARRQLTLLSRDRVLIVSRIVMSLALGLLNASTFFQFDEVDSQLVMGIGYVVTGFVMIGQSAQVPAFVAIRDVFKKQRRANFFRTSSFVLATSTSQIPLAVVETLIFGSIMYWMCGFVASAQGFLLFELLLFLTNMVFGAWFFFLAVICPDLNVANAISLLSDLLFSIYSGFVITKGEIPVYLSWIYWISPLTWGIRAIAVNQYTDTAFDVCTYRDVNYCERYGITMGEYSLSLFDVQTEKYWLWLGLVYLVAAYVVFMVMALFVLEYWCVESPPTLTLSSKDNAVKENYVLAHTPKTDSSHFGSDVMGWG